MKSEFNLGFIKGREIENYTLIKVLSIPYSRQATDTCYLYSVTTQVSLECSEYTTIFVQQK